VLAVAFTQYDGEAVLVARVKLALSYVKPGWRQRRQRFGARCGVPGKRKPGTTNEKLAEADEAAWTAAFTGSHRGQLRL